MKAPIIMLDRHPDVLIRRSVRVLAMLGELHKAGFQRLRGMPYMSDSGAHWRLFIGPASLFYRNHGALAWDAPYAPTSAERGLKEQVEAAVTYTSGSAASGEYFGWPDAAQDDARHLAAKFLDRFPRLAAMGEGWDYAYAGWFQRLLGLAERGWIPVVLSNSHGPTSRCIVLFDMRPAVWRDDDEPQPVLPLPPVGELRQDSDMVGDDQ